jgi:molybdopterin converting factor small subunit
MSGLFYGGRFLGVKVNIPYHLLQFVDNHEIVEVEGKTVKQCLLNLASKYPAMMPEVFDIDGDLAVIVLHGEAPIDDAALDSRVEDGDTLGLFPIIIGG